MRRLRLASVTLVAWSLCLMIPSESIYSYPAFNPPGQFDLWMNPGSHICQTPSAYHNFSASELVRYAPTGRFGGSFPHQYTLDIEFPKNSPPVDPGILALFKDKLLFRNPIRRPFPEIHPWNVATADAPFPSLSYTSPHWMSATFGTETIFDLKWFLAYTDSTFYNTVGYDGRMPEPSSLRLDPFDVDSDWQDADPSDIDTNHPTGQGWVLVLMKRKLVTASDDTPVASFFEVNNPFGASVPVLTQTPPITVEHHVYAAWQLLHPLLVQPTPPLLPFPITDLFIASPLPQKAVGTLPLFNPRITSEWTIFRNVLSIPAHQLFLRPQP